MGGGAERFPGRDFFHPGFSCMRMFLLGTIFHPEN